MAMFSVPDMGNVSVAWKRFLATGEFYRSELDNVNNKVTLSTTSLQGPASCHAVSS
jgi:hypothetical protein